MNPSFQDLEESDLDLVVAGTKSSVLMVESEAKQLSEDTMLGAVMYGHQELQVVIDSIESFVKDANVKSWNWSAPEKDSSLEKEIQKQSFDLLREAYTINNKLERKERIKEIKDEVVETIQSDEDLTWSPAEVVEEIEKLESHIVRNSVLSGENRIDGSAAKTVSTITIET